MHTGWLSAAPQRFVLVQTTLRRITCFEVPLPAHIVAGPVEEVRPRVRLEAWVDWALKRGARWGLGNYLARESLGPKWQMEETL